MTKKYEEKLEKQNEELRALLEKYENRDAHRKENPLWSYSITVMQPVAPLKDIDWNAKGQNIVNNVGHYYLIRFTLRHPNVYRKLVVKSSEETEYYNKQCRVVKRMVIREAKDKLKKRISEFSGTTNYISSRDVCEVVLDDIDDLYFELKSGMHTMISRGLVNGPDVRGWGTKCYDMNNENIKIFFYGTINR